MGPNKDQLRLTVVGASPSYYFNSASGVWPQNGLMKTVTMYTRMSSGVWGDTNKDGQIIVWVDGQEVINTGFNRIYVLNGNNRPDNVKIGPCGRGDNFKFWNLDCNAIVIPTVQTNSTAGVPASSVQTIECLEEGNSTVLSASGNQLSINDVGSAARGGWLKALLVDTGGTAATGLSDRPIPVISAVLLPQPYAAPTLSGSLQSGGSGTIGSVNYYAIATVHAGILSELSNVVGPFTATTSNRSVLLGFSALASGADSIRLYRSPQSNFLQMDRYRVMGYPYAVSDLVAATTSFVDNFMGIDTREGDGPDPHWDLNYRQTKYYSVSAVYEDGAESACSELVSVALNPRNAPLSVQINLTPPSAYSSPPYLYRLRRQNQTYGYALGLDRQWDIPISTAIFVDTNTDTTAADPCVVPATVTPTGIKPVYCLAGHCLKSVREVFVLKPDPLALNKEFVQVKQIEGVDFFQEIREVMVIVIIAWFLKRNRSLILVNTMKSRLT